MTQPTPEEIKRVCPEINYHEFHDVYSYRDEWIGKRAALALAQGRLENEKLLKMIEEINSKIAVADSGLDVLIQQRDEARIENERLRDQNECLRKRPELGPPPVFEEELNCDHQCAHCGADVKRLFAHYSHRLNREISVLKAGGVALVEENEKLKEQLIKLRLLLVLWTRARYGTISDLETVHMQTESLLENLKPEGGE